MSLPEAPKARNVKAWGNAPGVCRTRIKALKARHQLSPTHIVRRNLRRNFLETFDIHPEK